MDIYSFMITHKQTKVPLPMTEGLINSSFKSSVGVLPLTLKLSLSGPAVLGKILYVITHTSDSILS